MGSIRIGTSGYTYRHWRGPFYPPNLTYKKFLSFYVTKFDTVEINSSFYHLPREKTLENWYAGTPDNFTFALKASRFITHVKKLVSCQKPLHLFLTRALLLKEKLGPILFQFPPSWKKNLARLDKFLAMLPENIQATVELRHQSWFAEDLYGILRQRNCALTFADTPSYPLVEKITSNFVYIRLHGHERLYASNYGTKQLKTWARKIKGWSKKTVYVYFDNDAGGFAARNALELKKLLA